LSDIAPFLPQMNLLDRAVKMVAELDEPPEMNFVRKHALEQAAELNVSIREAATRVFSNASGSYSSNVNLAVENSSWNDEKQLQVRRSDKVSEGVQDTFVLSGRGAMCGLSFSGRLMWRLVVFLVIVNADARVDSGGLGKIEKSCIAVRIGLWMCNPVIEDGHLFGDLCGTNAVGPVVRNPQFLF
jgi:hypothetical protein